MPIQTHSFGRDVLLVEDEPRLREMLLRALREMGFEASGVASAEQALRLMEQRPHPVMIVDLNLPATSGMDLIRSVRRRWPGAQPIILTGFGDLDAARQAIHLDVVDFLTKPCALGDLEVALGRAFRRLLEDKPTDLTLGPLGAAQPNAMAPHQDFDEEADNDEFGGPSAADQPDDVNRGNWARDRRARNEPVHVTAFEPRDTKSALSIEEVERRAILAALEKHKGNRSAAAAELGISLRKLYYRLAQYQKGG